METILEENSRILEEMLEKAREYNEKLASSHVVLTDPFSGETNGGISEKEYYQLLNLDNTGVMCSLEIPSIDVDLPVYHGTSNSVLEKGVGHLEGTSLPVGGKDTHAVFTGHTGLNKAKLFTDLTELQKGDQFYIRVLDKILAYEVCRIDVVLPEDTSKLSVVDGQDLVTLVTCTPYGINTHRLVITGKRVVYEEKKEEEIKKKRPSVREMIFTMIPILFLVYVVIERIKRKREKRNCEGKRKRNRNQKRKCKHYRRKKRKRKKSRRQKRKMQKTAKWKNQMRNSSSFDMFSGGSSKEPGVCRNRNRKNRNLY